MNVAIFEASSSKRKREAEDFSHLDVHPQDSQLLPRPERLLGSSGPGQESLGSVSTASVQDLEDLPQKRRRSEQTAGMRPAANAMAGAGEQRASWVLERDMTVTEQERFRETIVANLGTRILYKHNELRLIDQEIAKCQIALEQLRRCSHIPYPGTTGVPSDMMHTSTGAGPALLHPRQGSQPQAAAPWGVTDGPYSRHYAEWLLPDARFDAGVSMHHSQAQNASESLTRMRGVQPSLDSVPTSSRSRAARGSTHAVLQSLPSGYAQPKPERSAQVLKRHADGKYVKLVCPGSNCGEQRFNSVQGFINHCRIKHQIHFATHEDAAKRAGTPEGVNQENGAVMDGIAPQSTVPGTLPSGTITQTSDPSPQQSGAFDSNQPQMTTDAQDRRASTDAEQPPGISPRQALSKPGTMSEGAVHATGNGTRLTHPYNRVELDIVRDWPEKRETPAITTSCQQFVTERRQSDMGPPISPAFVPSEQLPFLSKRFAQSGKAGNLAALLGEAQDRFDMDNVVMPDDSMDDITPKSPEHGSHRLHMNRKHETVGGLGAPLMDRRPGSKKGLQLDRSAQETGEHKDSALEGSTFLSSTTSRRRSERAQHPKARSLSHDMHLDTGPASPVTPPLPNIAFPRQVCSHSASPFELSPGAIAATESNQAPSLVSDDGQSASDSDHDEVDQQGSSTPRGSTNSTHISFDGTDEMMDDAAAGPSNLAVNDKMHRWRDDMDSRKAHRTT